MAMDASSAYWLASARVPASTCKSGRIGLSSVMIFSFSSYWRPPLRGLDASRPERGASVAEGRGGKGGSPVLQLLGEKRGNPAEGKALALKRRGALQGRMVERTDGGRTEERGDTDGLVPAIEPGHW